MNLLQSANPNPNALVPKSAVGAYRAQGNWMVAQIERTLSGRLQHRNRDGSLYCPRAIDALLLAPYYHLVVIDPQALWHFEPKDLMSSGMIDALRYQVRRPVRVFEYHADDGERLPILPGIVYVVSLQDLPNQNALAGRLPESAPLDLSRQRTPLHLPIGVTTRGDLWMSLAEMDGVLIGGARRLGKTNLLHGWIAALLQGGETRQVLFDGKGGLEFGRYTGKPRTVVVTAALMLTLRDLLAEMNNRFFQVFRENGATNLAEYNAGRAKTGRLERIVLIVDELAFALQEPGVEDALVDLIARGGAAGIHPVLATQRPSADVVTPRLKVNLSTRIALPVPDRASSMVVLDRSGAEAIAKHPGRLLISHGARIIEAQAYRVETGRRVDAARAVNSQQSVHPQLTANEVKVLRGSGEWVTVRGAAELLGVHKDAVAGILKRLELLGYLTTVQREAGTGKVLGRAVTEKAKSAP